MYTTVQPLYSLTQDQSKYKFRQPPEMDDFDQIVEYYIDRVSRASVLDDILFVLEGGFPLWNLTKIIIRSAVVEGRHTIEKGFLVRPILFEYLKGLAQQAEIEFVETFSTKAEDDAKLQARAVSLAKREMKKRKKDEGYDLVMAAVKAAGETQEEEEDMGIAADEGMPTDVEPQPEQMEMDLGTEEQVKPSGLMARG